MSEVSKENETAGEAVSRMEFEINLEALKLAQARFAGCVLDNGKWADDGKPMRTLSLHHQLLAAQQYAAFLRTGQAPVNPQK